MGTLARLRLVAVAALLAAAPAAAAANTATNQTVVSMTIQGAACSLSNFTDPSFGVLGNPISGVQTAEGTLTISCGSSSPTLKIAFNDASNSGSVNFTMTNSTTTTATATYQICDFYQFENAGAGTTCPNGFGYKNTTSDAHALSTAGTQTYDFVAYITPPTGGIDYTSGSYFDTLTETISF